MTQTDMTLDRPVEIDVPADRTWGSAAAALTGGGGRGLDPSDTFIHRHIGPDDAEIRQMLDVLGYATLDVLCDATIPKSIRLNRPLNLGEPRGERELINGLRAIARKNRVFRSFIGMGYYGTITPPVIQRSILENPGWYTQYTPYQAEIAQGRLEALLNFQTMVADLTGLPLANASLLDEATAAAEAMTMCLRIVAPLAERGDAVAPLSERGDATRRMALPNAFFVSEDCHPQTIDVVKTRARSLGVEVIVGDLKKISFDDPKAHGLQSVGFSGILVQYPTTDGRVEDYENLAKRAHEHGALLVVATDLLALTLFKPPGEFGADIAIGSSQRFGVPMGAGGPHAAFISTKEEYVRKMPGRIIGVSRDAHGNPALRMAIQTREQHIRRDRATSNICTAQVLLAIMASMYAVYHGPEGLKRMAKRVRALTHALRVALRRLGHEINDNDLIFDTIRVRPVGIDSQTVLENARSCEMNFRDFGDGSIGISLDQTTTCEDVERVIECFEADRRDGKSPRIAIRRRWENVESQPPDLPRAFARTTEFLTHPVFNTRHSETEMLRYIRKLESRDLSLAHSMIPLGSCTMKLNATTEMLPVTWPEFADIHPFAPAEQTQGYQELYGNLEEWLCEMTGFAACSLQPNAGSQGEYAGLLAIRAFHESRQGDPSLREGHHHSESGGTTRNVCLIPTSAHGTNPASAVIAGLKVVSVECDDNGNIDLDDLRTKSEKHRDSLAAIMITYPSTHGVFEESIREICDIVHEHGGLVYLDGANMNAMVGLCRPGDFGADVCHLNLHKTFCIPHGGGGPGMGPICVTAELAPFLPRNPALRRDATKGGIDTSADSDQSIVGPVAAAPYGSPSILPISWAYIALMGAEGLKLASQVAILSANYMARRLDEYYDVLYTGRNGRVAHEFILDCRPFKKSAGIEIDDIAKRLMDYGFHAPTMSWPVPATLMIEPTESESKGEIDRYCDALISIRAEIREIESGEADREDNVLKGSPHTIAAVSADEWKHPYSREKAAFPAPWLREWKFWPPVSRIDNPWGDRNLVCTCPTVVEFAG